MFSLLRLPVALCILIAVLATTAACTRGSDESPPAARADGEAAADVFEAPEVGPEAAADPDPTRIDPCALVTQEEAEAIVKVRLDGPQSFNLGSSRPSCVYNGFPTGPVAKVDIRVGEGAQSLVDTDRRLNERDPNAFRAVEDLGEEAWLRHATVYFRRGETWIVVGAVRMIDASQMHEPLIAAARAADARLLSGEAVYAP